MSDPGFRDRCVLWAMRCVGRPYVWGANGPDGFDCSGFVLWVWRQAGINLPDQTSNDLYKGLEAVQVPEPGDLAFYSSPGKPDRATHVVLVLTRGGTCVVGANGGGPPNKGETADQYAARMRSRNAMVRVEDARRNGIYYREGFMGCRGVPKPKLP